MTLRVCPDFLIIGAQKSGTSSLYHALLAHAEICMSREKELHYFDRGTDYPAVDWYRAQFNFDAARHRACGEATPIYCFYPNCLDRIQAYNPAAKLIFILRDPVKRALSQYWMEYRRGDETLPPDEAFKAEPERIHRDDFSLRHHSYLSRGYYARQLDALYARFPEDQVLVMEFEALLHNTTISLGRIGEFLGIPSVAALDFPHIFRQDYPSPGDEILTWLSTHFAQHNHDLCQRYPLDISHWL